MIKALMVFLTVFSFDSFAQFGGGSTVEPCEYSDDAQICFEEADKKAKLVKGSFACELDIYVEDLLKALARSKDLDTPFFQLQNFTDLDAFLNDNLFYKELKGEFDFQTGKGFAKALDGTKFYVADPVGGAFGPPIIIKLAANSSDSKKGAVSAGVFNSNTYTREQKDGTYEVVGYEKAIYMSFPTAPDLTGKYELEPLGILPGYNPDYNYRLKKEGSTLVFDNINSDACSA